MITSAPVRIGPRENKSDRRHEPVLTSAGTPPRSQPPPTEAAVRYAIVGWDEV